MHRPSVVHHHRPRPTEAPGSRVVPTGHPERARARTHPTSGASQLTRGDPTAPTPAPRRGRRRDRLPTPTGPAAVLLRRRARRASRASASSDERPTPPAARPRVEEIRRGVRRSRLPARAPRHLASAAFLVLACLGLRAIFLAALARPDAVARPPPAADAPSEDLALRFARAYLTFDAADPAAREEALAPYLPGGLSAGAGFDATRGSRRVLWEDVASDQPSLQGGRVITVAAEVSGTAAPLYLAVTVRHEPGRPLSLVGYPALVGAPAITTSAAEPARQAVSDPEVTEVVERVLRNYLAGSAPELRADLTGDAAGHPADRRPAGPAGRAGSTGSRARVRAPSSPPRPPKTRRRHLHPDLRTRHRLARAPLRRLHRGRPDPQLTTTSKEDTMRNRTIALLAALVLALGLSASAASARSPPRLPAPPSRSRSKPAKAAARPPAPGTRFGNLLSGWGVPAITALAGCLLIGALATRNIGASVGIVAITLLSLIFLLAPQSVETFAKGIANVVF